MEGCAYAARSSDWQQEALFRTLYGFFYQCFGALSLFHIQALYRILIPTPPQLEVGRDQLADPQTYLGFRGDHWQCQDGCWRLYSVCGIVGFHCMHESTSLSGWGTQETPRHWVCHSLDEDVLRSVLPIASCHEQVDFFRLSPFG